jgi:hypothetical protein
MKLSDVAFFLMHQDHFLAQQAFGPDMWGAVIRPAPMSRRPERLRGVELMRKVRKAWPIWTTMRLQGRARALPHEASRIQRREERKHGLRTAK